MAAFEVVIRRDGVKKCVLHGRGEGGPKGLGTRALAGQLGIKPTSGLPLTSLACPVLNPQPMKP